MIRPGIFLNGKVLISALVNSLITHFLRPISFTCSFVVVALRLASPGIVSKIYYNYLSIIHFFIVYIYYLIEQKYIFHRVSK